VFDAVSKDLRHPFTRQEVICDIADDVLIESHFDTKAITRVKASRRVPRLNPKAPRFIHVDIGLTNDALGIAMGHVAGQMKTERIDAEGNLSTVLNPFIVMDFMLRVRAPAGGEVDLSKVRAFILYIKRMFPLCRVTFDQYQSSDSIQILKKSHIDAAHQSVDKFEDAYITLRSAHFDRRIAIYNYEPYIDEVLDLERIIKDRGRHKVDHPKKATKGGIGSKDVSDAVAGVVWQCIHDDRAMHESVAEVEITSAATAPQTDRGAQDFVKQKGGQGKTSLGVTGKSLEDLRSNV